MHPTTELYDSLQIAFEHFNSALFDSKLDKVIFTVQRQKGVMGYFAPDRWGNLKGKKCHEIAINPSYIANCRLIEVMQTLVHEMAHCWQHCFGSPGRVYYHNKEWAYRMIEIGLMPSSTGEPGGDITGQHMGDYIIKDGKFLKSFNQLKIDDRFQLKWIDRKSLPRLFDPIIADPDEAISDALTGQNVDINLPEWLPELRHGSETSPITHYEDSDSSVFADLMPDNFIFHDVAKRKTRFRYICNGCGVKIYGKARLNVRCGDCDQLFEYGEVDTNN